MATRFGGIPAAVEVTAQQVAAAVEAVRRRDPETVTKKSSVVARLPISGDMCLYVASADYDPRDWATISRAEMSGRRQAQRYLEAIRSIPGCENAYLVATGPEFGTRESRHINARQKLTWQDIENPSIVRRLHRARRLGRRVARPRDVRKHARYSGRRHCLPDPARMPAERRYGEPLRCGPHCGWRPQGRRSHPRDGNGPCERPGRRRGGSGLRKPTLERCSSDTPGLARPGRVARFALSQSSAFVHAQASPGIEHAWSLLVLNLFRSRCD